MALSGAYTSHQGPAVPFNSIKPNQYHIKHMKSTIPAIFFFLNEMCSTIDASHLNIPVFFSSYPCNILLEMNKNDTGLTLDPSLYLDLHQKLMGSILGRDPFSPSVMEIHSDVFSNQPTNTLGWKHNQLNAGDEPRPMGDRRTEKKQKKNIWE